jgi:alpha-beta hydrolase superfamily lysophospholipase
MFSSGEVFREYLQFARERGYDARAIELYRDQENRFTGVGNISLRDYTERAAREINFFSEGEKYVVVGHSLGGLIIMSAVSQGLISPESLILLTPAAPRGIPSLTFSVIWCFTEIFAETLWRQKPARISFAKARYAFFEFVPTNQRYEIFRSLVPESSRVIEEVGLWFFDKAESSAVDGRKFNCDTLIIGARLDKITPVSVVRKIYRKLDKEVDSKFKVEYKEFADHAHWLLAEPGWEDVIGFALLWLEEDSTP